MRYLGIAAATAAIGIIVLAALLYFSDAGIDLPVRHQLPDGFRGWALIQYQRPACPALSTQGIHLIIPYDATGRACTSSLPPAGWRYRSVVYVHRDGTRRAIPETMLHVYSHSINDNADTFFVGTEADFAADRTPLARRFKRDSEPRVRSSP